MRRDRGSWDVLYVLQVAFFFLASLALLFYLTDRL